jgi:glyoxylase-like metal-dependent hydrolase (beta-lactamase superfamily II)
MEGNPFSLKFNFEPGKVHQLQRNIRRIIAPNGSPMTFTGTNTYLVGNQNLAVIDPGPNIKAHLNSILASVTPNQSITHILITHSHIDHSPLAKILQEKTNAPIYAFGDSFSGRSKMMMELTKKGDLKGGEGLDENFSPDVYVKDGDQISSDEWCFDAIWTPGHLGNHLCYGLKKSGVLFSADHVMGWATSLVSPPDGDLTQFMDSLQKLLKFDDYNLYYPGHGDKIDNPKEIINYIIKHRKMREKQILKSIAEISLNSTQIAEKIYIDVNKSLIPAAARNVFAHLIDLKQRQLVTNSHELNFETIFSSI